jgi:putative inorganic carbon (HCO3(-)) transporter
LLSRLESTLTLKALDQYWKETLDQSLLLRPFPAIKRLVPSRSQIGNALQSASFVIAACLFAALALPQFANDKEGLAFVAASGFGLWLLGYLLGGKETHKPGAIDALVLLYLAANIVSTGASHYFAASARGLAKVIVYILSYFYLTSILAGKPKRRVALMAVLGATALAVSLYGFYQYHIHVEPLATWEDPTVESKGTRIFSTLGNPNLLAGYLLPTTALIASLGMAALSVKRWLVGVPIICISVAVALATVLTGSRGGYLGLFALGGMLLFTLVASVWRDNPKLRLPMIGALLVTCVGGLLALHFVPGFEQRITSIFAGREHSSNAFRMNVWHSSLKMFKDNWWFGIGPGNQAFRLAYGLYMVSGFDALGTYSVPLEVGVETGVLGLASFSILIIALLARGHVSFWSDRSWERWIAAGAAAALVGMMVHGLVDTVFYRPQVQFIFWLIVSLLVTVNLPSQQQRD